MSKHKKPPLKLYRAMEQSIVEGQHLRKRFGSSAVLSFDSSFYSSVIETVCPFCQDQGAVEITSDMRGRPVGEIDVVCDECEGHFYLSFLNVGDC